MPELLRFSALLLLILDSVYSTSTQNTQNDAQASASVPVGSQSSTLSDLLIGRSTTPNATCPSRTANYITHTLPQQCLRTDRASPNASDSLNTTSAINIATSTPSPVISNTSSATEDQVTAINPSNIAGNTSSGSETVSVGPSHVATASGETPTTTIHEPDSETDSPLDNANFLSFEEWKRQNLVKAGQSPENIGARSQALDGERKRPGINNALDTLGEESEIELDFSGFGASHDHSDQERSSDSAPNSVETQSSLAPQTARSKDAGKTCKERTNYASFDCAATILKNNPESKSGSSVLVENKDSYMLNKCSAKNKFIIVELCNDILIDTIVMANYEFFSSIFRHFRISVSDRYPVKTEKWKDLGTFEARNTREVQAFLVENPLIWARYLRIEFLTHYGNEYYCPVSLLRVHGTTMMDEFRHQEALARGELHDDEIVVEPDVPPQTTVPPETQIVSSLNVQNTGESDANVNNSSKDFTPDPSTSTVSKEGHEPSAGHIEEIDGQCSVKGYSLRPFSLLTLEYPSCRIDEQSHSTGKATSSPDIVNVLTSLKSPTTSAPDASATAIESNVSGSSSTTTKDQKAQMPQPDAQNNTSNTTPGSTSEVKSASTAKASASTSSAHGSDTASSGSHAQEEAAATALPKSSSTPTNGSTRAGPSSTTAHPAQPSTQESFFKSVHKRLQQLESNSTLSLQYIEEQSRILRDAFSKVEKRQLASTTNFLSHLNSTVMGELQGFRQAYDQLWQSTVIELEGQREQYQREMVALSTRLTLVADELVWQKRMGIVQSTLLLLCLALVLFNRTGNSALVEMPLLQHMMNKSQAALRSGWESPVGSRSPEDRSPENRSPVSLFRKKLWRHATEPGSGHATDATDSRPQSRDAMHGGPEVTLRAPTPPNGLDSDSEDEGEWKEVPEIQSGPATPRGTREALGSPTWPDGGIRPSSSLN